jgi:hypothetical protein
MAKSSFEAGIADLEKTNATPVLQIEKAARLIGIDLAQIIQQSPHEVRYKYESGSCGFKEQWLLRWLLKKLSFPTPKENSDEVWTAENR